MDSILSQYLTFPVRRRHLSLPFSPNFLIARKKPFILCSTIDDNLSIISTKQKGQISPTTQNGFLKMWQMSVQDTEEFDASNRVKEMFKIDDRILFTRTVENGVGQVMETVEGVVKEFLKTDVYILSIEGRNIFMGYRDLLKCEPINLTTTTPLMEFEIKLNIVAPNIESIEEVIKMMQAWMPKKYQFSVCWLADMKKDYYTIGVSSYVEMASYDAARSAALINLVKIVKKKGCALF